MPSRQADMNRYATGLFRGNDADGAFPRQCNSSSDEHYSVAWADVQTGRIPRAYGGRGAIYGSAVVRCHIRGSECGFALRPRGEGSRERGDM